MLTWALFLTLISSSSLLSRICPESLLQQLYGRIDPPSEVLNWVFFIFFFQLERTLTKCFDSQQDSDSQLLRSGDVIINGALNPEVSLVSCCQGRLSLEGVICSQSCAPLPTCLQRKTNSFYITFYSFNIHTRPCVGVYHGVITS